MAWKLDQRDRLFIVRKLLCEFLLVIGSLFELSNAVFFGRILVPHNDSKWFLFAEKPGTFIFYILIFLIPLPMLLSFSYLDLKAFAGARPHAYITRHADGEKAHFKKALLRVLLLSIGGVIVTYVLAWLHI